MIHQLRANLTALRRALTAWLLLTGVAWTAHADVGPFLFDQATANGGRISGFRPFYVKWTSVPHYGGAVPSDLAPTPLPGGDRRQTLEEYTVLYPLFYYRDYGSTYDWNVFQLINHYGIKRDAPPGTRVPDEDQSFQLFPFYFSRTTGNPATSYRALLPIAGRIQDRFWNDQISFVAFPLWAQTKRHGAVTTWVPFPFVRLTHGAESGFELWPLYGHRERPGAFTRTYFFWPFIWTARFESAAAPDSPAGAPPAPTYDRGLLPLFASTDGPSVTSRDFLWPFFGYTDRRAPYRYHETRYFWPFFVQGRGDDHYHNRWGPFYTHSVVKGKDKLWAPWPLYKRFAWTDGDVRQTQTQLGYFFYFRREQHKISNPAARPAEKTHYWPLLSTWDNGAGRRQWQFPSPLQIYFQDNREMLQTWSAFVTLYTHDEKPDGEVRNSVLWNAFVWGRRPGGRPSWRLFGLEIPFRQHNLTQTAARRRSATTP